MEMNLVNIGSVVAGFVAFLMAVFLLTLKTERRLPNYLLAFFLILFMQDTLAYFTSYYIYPLSPVAGMLFSDTIYLFMPVIYLFVKSSVYRDFRLTTRSLIHLGPYIMINAIMIPGYFLVHLRGEFNPEYQVQFYASFTYKLVYILYYVQAIVYYILILNELRRYRQILIENYSSPEMGNYRWLM